MHHEPSWALPSWPQDWRRSSLPRACSSTGSNKRPWSERGSDEAESNARDRGRPVPARGRAPYRLRVRGYIDRARCPWPARRGHRAARSGAVAPWEVPWRAAREHLLAQRHEPARAMSARALCAIFFFEQRELLDERASEGRDQAAVPAELLDQRGRERRRGAGEEDAIEGPGRLGAAP